MTASVYGQTDVVKVLLKAGAEINATDTMGATALRKAREYGQAKVVSILTKAGARE